MNQGWGVGSGEKAWDDERAGERIAQSDENEPQTPAGEEAKEPADTSKSFADYMAEKAAQGDFSAKPVRAANEGTKNDQWANAKELKRDEEDSEYIKGKEEKAKAPKQRKEKAYVDVDMRYVEPPRGGNGGRGGPRGRGRGARGGGRGGRGNGPRGVAGPTVDEKNFPSLGA